MEIDLLESESSRVTILAITLLTFPHIERQLSAGLRRATAVLADEVHRSQRPPKAFRMGSAGLRRSRKLSKGHSKGPMAPIGSRRLSKGPDRVPKPFEGVTSGDVRDYLPLGRLAFFLGRLTCQCLVGD